MKVKIRPFEYEFTNFSNKEGRDFTATLTQVSLGELRAAVVNLNDKITYHSSLVDALNYMASNIPLTRSEQAEMVRHMCR